MIKKIFALLLALVFFTSASNVSAHLVGQPPYFKVNGKLSGFYPVQSLSIESKDFEISQDAAPENYYVGIPINLELDESVLETFIPKNVIDNTKFNWDFGDGTNANDLTSVHTYNKMGSYLLSIYVDTSKVEKGVAPQLLESVLLQVLPDKNYKLPKISINVNDKEGVTEANLKNKIMLTAIVEPSSAKIKSYFWDLGDQTTSRDRQLSHQYSEADNITPALRVIDENGFKIDTSTSVKHNPDPIKQTGVKSKMNLQIYIILAGTFVVGLFVLLALKRK